MRLSFFLREDRADQRFARPVPAQVALLVLVIALLAGPRTPPAEASEPEAFVAAVNKARASHGLRPLRLAQSLRRSSGDYANWMLDHEHFAHVDSIRAPHRFRLRGEVLAVTPDDHPSVGGIAAQWLASPSHRRVLLDRRFRFIGVGVARGWLEGEPATVVTGHLGGRVRTR